MRVVESDDSAADEVLGRVLNAELGRESGPRLCLRFGLPGKLWAVRVEDSDGSATEFSEELGPEEHEELGRESGPKLCLRFTVPDRLLLEARFAEEYEWPSKEDSDGSETRLDEAELGRVEHAELWAQASVYTHLWRRQAPVFFAALAKSISSPSQTWFKVRSISFVTRAFSGFGRPFQGSRILPCERQSFSKELLKDSPAGTSGNWQRRSAERSPLQRAKSLALTVICCPF